MSDFPRLHAQIRDLQSWHGVLVGVGADAAGDLRLLSLPAACPPTDLPPEGTAEPPFAAAPSGIAIAPCHDVILSDGEAGGLLIALARGDAAQLRAPAAPAGIAGAGHILAVAAPEEGQIRFLRLPDLNHWGTHPGTRPTGLAADSEGRFLVADPGVPAVRRLTPRRAPDAAFDSAVATHMAARGGWSEPAFVAAGARDWVLVSDPGRGEVMVIDETGTPLGTLDPPGPGWHPGALAADAGGRVYVADRATGLVHAMDGPSGQWLGPLPGWRGPVAAMALGPDGTLYLKPGAAPHAHGLPPSLSAARLGSVASGPFDAGRENGWARLDLDATLPGDGAPPQAGWVSAEVRFSMTPDPMAAPWITLPGLGAALDLAAHNAGLPELHRRRFAWMRVTLRRGTSSHGPILRQAMLTTAGRPLIAALPRVFARSDGALSDPPPSGGAPPSPRGLLGRLLALLGSGHDAGGRTIDGLAQSLTALFARPEGLEMLAGWLAIDLPGGADLETRRQLVARAVLHHARRGTPTGLRGHLARQTGARTAITETFRERGIWMLDVSARLGFDTMLPVIDPLGLVLEGPLPGGTLSDTATPGPCGGTVTFGGRRLAPEGCPQEGGQAVVGATAPIPQAEVWQQLFTPFAHHFRVHATSWRTQVTPPGPGQTARQSFVVPKKTGAAAPPMPAADTCDPPGPAREGRHSTAATILGLALDAERPAHTEAVLCVASPGLRVGLQARIGLDAIVAEGPAPGVLDAARLDTTLTLGPRAPATFARTAITGTARLGIDTASG